MNKRIYLNNQWLYKKENEENKEIVNLPHANIETPYNYFDEKIYQFISIYEKEIFIENEWKNKHLFLNFDGVLHQSKIYLNDELLLIHNCGYDSFNVDLKDKCKYGELNTIKVITNSKEDLNIPPFGYAIDYLTYGGIYRDVYLNIKEESYIKDVFVKPINIENKWYISLDIEVSIANDTNIDLTVLQDEKPFIVMSMKEMNYEDLRIEIPSPILWDIDNPYLYQLKIETETDERIINFGLRTAVFKSDGFYLNNQLVKLIGLNRHQSYPYVGYAMPKSMQIEDARILKEELGVNAVRTSHYMQSQYFLDECDRLGILVFTETPGWQYLGDEEWQNQVIENVHQMVVQNRNHPSVILWGARINESKDCHDLYLKTNSLIHSLDPTRQTGGVRCYTKGEELEDVYTYNDFTSDNDKRILQYKKKVVKNKNLPYLVSEFNGHMYPTKAIDDEMHKELHMLRYAKIFDVFFSDKEITGLFGWCMFDYNTHKDFGSGDKICYHGVMDMYRNPKLAANLYHSINIDDNEIYLSSLLKAGDHPTSLIKSFYVLTSADRIRFYRNDELIKEYDHNDSPFKNIKNAPILVDDFVGDLLIKNEGFDQKTSDDAKQILYAILNYGTKLPLKYKLKYLKLMLFKHLSFEKGYELYGKYIGNWGTKQLEYRIEAIKDNQVVNSICIKDSTNIHLELKISNNNLIIGNSYDVASIRIRALDDNNNLAPYYNEGFKLSTTGPIKLIGPSILNLRGGMGGTYVKTGSEIGEAILNIDNDYLHYEIKFNITKENK